MEGKAEWIWHNGDYEIMQLNRCLTSRYEREVFIPPFWRTDDFCKNVKFVKTFKLDRPERIFLKANGKCNVIVDRTEDPRNEFVRNFDGSVLLGPGDYRMTVSVYNETGLPALYVRGETVFSDKSFLSTCNDFRYLPAGTDGLTDPDLPPGDFAFSYEEVDCEVLERDECSLVADCKREMMGRLDFSDCRGEGEIRVFYGESELECRDEEGCELTDVLEFPAQRRTPAKAFRYLNVRFGEGVSEGKVRVDREYLPQARSSSFLCSDELINKIYEISLYTLSLNTRDFFLDGIKRDRWVWAADAYQSFLMNYYSFFDVRTAKRTMTALAGKPPVATYMNHIMEYSFYWIIGLYDFYRYVGDTAFIGRLFPVAEEIVGLTRTRMTERGLIRGRPSDWVFVDWANLDNRGEVTAEQIIYLKALDTMSLLCGVLGLDGSRYAAERDALRERLFGLLWDEERGVFDYSFFDGRRNREIKKHPHIFALFYDLLDERRRGLVIRNVLTNDEAEKIVTPYMRFYELSALCKAGRQDYVLDEIRSYWGGMIEEGATSFWELYDREEKGPAKYAMYNRPYGKSLCHAWGASPLYLIGRYFVGLEPAEPGYQSFLLTPVLSDLDWFETSLPIKEGEVRVRMDRKGIEVHAEGADGTLRLDKARYRPDRFDGETEEYYLCGIANGTPMRVEIRCLRKEEE